MLSAAIERYLCDGNRHRNRPFEIGAPGEIRTPDHCVRSAVLYPTELRARGAQIVLCPPRKVSAGVRSLSGARSRTSRRCLQPRAIARFLPRKRHFRPRSNLGTPRAIQLRKGDRTDREWSNGMGTRSSFLSALELAALGLVCSLPLTAIRADAPATAPGSRLESLLTAHDVRYAIQSPRASSSDCLYTEAERGR
jgi:hypothetical protein